MPRPWTAPAALMVAVAALLMHQPAAAAPAAGPISSIDDLKRAFASVLAGEFPAAHCGELGNPQGDLSWPGALRISATGKILAPRDLVRMDMFDSRGSMVLGRRYPPYPPKMTNALFFYELRVGDELFRIEPDKTVDSVFLETGNGGGTGNANTGVECPDVNMSTARIAATGYDMNELLLPVFDTRGATVTGQCRAMGGRVKPRPADRTATLKVGAQGIWIDGKLLPFGDSGRRIVEHSLGSRFADGSLNGGYSWADGSAVHMERMGLASSNAPFATFAFHLPDMPEGVLYTCRPGGFFSGSQR
ncbi:hypothetical protein AACH06_09750 [Ideonella sp. DXS29W]|uniref:Uncharacterized protein n=1 Tax=Ideonella lacteola TaxID=2984193 RepID=A0ABU9BQG1_9BURK